MSAGHRPTPRRLAAARAGGVLALYASLYAAPAQAQTPDTTPPTLDTAVVNGDTLTLTYDEALDDTSTPANSAFTVSVAGTPQTVSMVEISVMEVTLTLSGAVTSGDTVTVTYMVPGSNPVQDAAGNDGCRLDDAGQ